MRRMGKMILVVFLVNFAGVLLLGCQSGGETKSDSSAAEKAKAQKPSGPAVTGKLESPPMTGLGFQRAVLVLDVSPSGEVTGQFEGGYDQKPFEVPLNGQVAEDGTLTASGTVTEGEVTVSGPLDSNGFQGEVAGEIFAEQFSLMMPAEVAKSE